jgi:hypothetical protein
MEILSAIQTLGDMELIHVYGHHNETDPTEPLLWEAELNQRCDDLTTAHLATSVESFPLVPFLPASQVSLTVQDKAITHHIPTQFWTYARRPAGIPGLSVSAPWMGPPVFYCIDWPTLHACTQMLSFLKRLFTVKWTSDLLPFQAQQLR